MTGYGHILQVFSWYTHPEAFKRSFLSARDLWTIWNLPEASGSHFKTARNH